MNEFDIIAHYFKPIQIKRPEVILGVGDDCALLAIPAHHLCCVSTDTLVAGVHFLPEWFPEDIAYKAVMVNLSDCAAMGATPIALTLALTLPQVEEAWLARFARGLQEALQAHQVALIGGDLTRGALSLTGTVQGIVPRHQAIKRSGASPGDRLYVTGSLGLAAFAVGVFEQTPPLPHPLAAQKARYQAMTKEDALAGQTELALLKKALHFPAPRLDFEPILRDHASSAIDISDGLCAEIYHLCAASGLGARIALENVPVHPLVQKYQGAEALTWALQGGDDYELCFTVSEAREATFLEAMSLLSLSGTCIGVMTQAPGVWGISGETQTLLRSEGYQHFK